jgi:hypothetical protein
MSRLTTVLKIGAGALLAAAVAEELPADRRTWHGEVAGFIPYDLRPPTLDRLKRTFWAPDDPRILTPRALGVGWGVNVARLAQLSGIDVG